jgi:hypothetical protein
MIEDIFSPSPAQQTAEALCGEDKPTETPPQDACLIEDVCRSIVQVAENRQVLPQHRAQHVRYQRHDRRPLEEICQGFRLFSEEMYQTRPQRSPSFNSFPFS